MFSKEEAERYSRHLRLKDFGEEAQEKLKTASVLVIGAGGLGCPVLQYLIAAGVGTIGIADPDVVALSNLQRQVLYTTADIGQKKADVAATRLKALNPHSTINTYTERVNHQNADRLINAYDIVIDTTDNIPARYQISDACVRNNKPLIYGAIFRWEGQVSVFNYRNGPTYRCLFPEPPGEIVLSCDQEGVVGVVPGIIGSLQALECIKLITATGEVLSGKLLSVDLNTFQTSIVKFRRRDESILKAYEDPGITELDTEGMHQHLEEQKITILDVRNPDEFERENVGGLNIPLPELRNHFGPIMEKKSVIVICQSGRRSVEAIRQLREAGFSGTCYNLTEGLSPFLASRTS